MPVKYFIDQPPEMLRKNTFTQDKKKGKYEKWGFLATPFNCVSPNFLNYTELGKSVQKYNNNKNEVCNTSFDMDNIKGQPLVKYYVKYRV